VHWGTNGWKDTQDQEATDTGLGVWATELTITGLNAGETIQFTFYWHDRAAWEGQDYEVTVD
jgi:glucoamylase